MTRIDGTEIIGAIAPRLVLIEDALNLGDALYGAYLDYEPIRRPTLHSYNGGISFGIINRPQPSLGAIILMIELCQHGAFFIDGYS